MINKMKVRDLDLYSRDNTINNIEDMENSRERDKLVRKYKDKRKTKDRKIKRKQKTRGYYV